jgi:hypothetical protein
MISRDEAISLFDGRVGDLAAALGYKSRHSVYMWPRTGPIPEVAYLKLRYEIKPEAFGQDGKLLCTQSIERAA